MRHLPVYLNLWAQFNQVLVIKFKDLYILGKHSTYEATFPALVLLLKKESAHESVLWISAGTLPFLWQKGKR